MPGPPETADRRVVLETIGRTAWLEQNEPAWADGRWKLAWRPMCASPCAIDVPSSGLYRVSGPGVTSSARFRLPADRTAVYVHANPGSATGWGWGLAGMIFGGASLSIGGLMLAGGSTCDPADAECGASRTRGIVTLLTMGGIAGLGGLYLWLANGTDVSLTNSPSGGGTASLFGLKLSREGVTF